MVSLAKYRSLYSLTNLTFLTQWHDKLSLCDQHQVSNNESLIYGWTVMVEFNISPFFLPILSQVWTMLKLMVEFVVICGFKHWQLGIELKSCQDFTPTTCGFYHWGSVYMSRFYSHYLFILPLIIIIYVLRFCSHYIMSLSFTNI